MDFLLDTNILVGYLQDATYSHYLDQRYQPLVAPNTARISVVSEGEMFSLAFQRSWGEGKMERLRSILAALPSEEIKQGRVVELYAEIDAYSQGKLPTHELPMTSRNMGKNDLWIAATAAVLNASLVTADHDFDHLHDVFIEVIYIDPRWTEDDV